MIQRSHAGADRRRRQRGALGCLAAVAFAATIFLTACAASRPGTIVDPEVSGVVTSVSPIVGSTSAVTVDGRQIEIDLEGRKVMRLYSDAHLDGVLLYGANPRPWYIGTAPPDDDCYFFGSTAAFDDPDTVIFVFSELGGVGIRIPKAAGFDPGPALSRQGDTAGQYVSLGGPPPFCLDAQGRVTRALGGPPQPTSSP